MYFKQVKFKEFRESIEQATFRTNDEKECISFGSTGVLKCLKDIEKLYTRYFLILDDNDNDNICAYIALPRNGRMSFFVSDNIKHKLGFVKELRNIAKWYTDNYETTIFTKTANWYNEANKINVLVGFKKQTMYDEYTVWVYENKR